MKKFLVIEDDPAITELVELYLEKEGYKVLIAMDGETGIKLFRTENPDFVILDLGLPRLDGIEVARIIRSESSIPILMLTARSEEVDKVLGLEIGADDYVTKPFSPRELVARVKAILRRMYTGAGDDTPPLIRAKDLEIDLEKFQVKQDGEEVKFSAMEFRILSRLAAHPGRVFSRAKLLDEIYNEDSDGVMDRTIDVHIKNIRKKLGDDPREPKYIVSVYGVGYRFAE